PGAEPEVLLGGQVEVECRLLEDDADLTADAERLALDVEAGDPRRAARRLEQRRQHPDRGRLAGAVRAEEAEELAGTDVEVDRVDRPDATVVATESRNCDGGYGGHVPAESLAPRRGHRIGRPVGELAVAVAERSLRRLARLHDHRVVGREV